MDTNKTVIKGLVVAGTHSGSGKTTVALGLMAAFKRRGLKVCAFKVGQVTTGRVSKNMHGVLILPLWKA